METIRWMSLIIILGLFGSLFWASPSRLSDNMSEASFSDSVGLSKQENPASI